MKPALALPLALVSALLLAIPVSADQPTKTPLAITYTNVLTDVCPFPVDIAGTLSGTQIDFLDQSGALIRTAWHVAQQDTFSANGKTLVGLPFRYSATWLYDSQGTPTNIYVQGVYEKIPLPDGSLFISAGRADFLDHPGVLFLLSPDRGNPGNVAGFCAALAP